MVNALLNISFENLNLDILISGLFPIKLVNADNKIARVVVFIPPPVDNGLPPMNIISPPSALDAGVKLL